MIAEDEFGMGLPTILAAFEEGNRIGQDLLNDPDTAELRGGVTHIVGSQGRLFVSPPIGATALRTGQNEPLRAVYFLVN
jgi:hypothetical protein